MADNESTISMEAEISVNSTKAVSGVDKLSKSIEGISKEVSNLSKELESALKNIEKIAASANQSVSNMSKADINKTVRQLAQAPQRAMPKNSKVKNKRGKNIQGSNASINQSNTSQIESTTNDVNSEVIELVNRFKGVVSSLENINKNVNQLNDVMDTAERKSYEAVTKRKNAEVNEAREKRKAEESSSQKELNDAKTLYYKAAAGAKGDDYRFKPGLYGGIASGFSGMNNRLRSRSGFAGFAARVGTGVGQKFGMNAFKGATMSGLGLNLGTAAFGAAGVAVTKLVEAIGKLSVESLRAYGEVEKLKTSLSVVYGSDVEANTAFSGIKDYALESPFGIEQSTEMAILLKQSGVYGTELLDVMKMIGDTAGGNEEKFRRIANNYAQIASIGKASMLDMRQFAYAGIPIYKMVAEELKVSQSVLRQMISDGEVTNEVIEKVFKTMTSEGGTFYKAVERGAATLNARLVNLQDAMEMAKAAFGEWAFNVDIPGTGGNSLDGEGTFGKILTYIEDIAAKADAWASLINIQKDVAAISGRAVATDELSLLISQMELAGKDTTGLQNIRNELSSLDTGESVLATRTSAYDQADKKLAALENVISLELELESLEDVDLRGLDDQTKKYIKQYIQDLKNQIKDAYSLTRIVPETAFTRGETTWDMSRHFRDREGRARTYTSEYYELKNLRSGTTPDKYQSVANSVALSLFEQQQKIARSSSSLNTFAGNAELRARETEAGKAKALEKEKAEYEKNFNEFNRLRQYIDDSGNLIDSMNADLGVFHDIMKSGIIEPLEAVSLTFFDLAKNAEDSAKTASEKTETWQGMQGRADDISKYKYIVPSEFKSSFNDILNALKNPNGNTEENINFINTALKDMSKSPAFQNAEMLQSMLTYLFTKNASVAIDPPTFQETQNRKGSSEEFIPLWKRITGSATGIDPSKITTAMDFYDIYTKQFQNRNLSRGIISGMVASGRSAKDITRNLRYTGERSKTDDTLLIDWERTAEAMHDFAMSSKATVFELQAYQNALSEQIGVYDTLKETIFTTGEDWEKLDGQALSKQLENAFSGIDGAKMMAVNNVGDTEELEFNDQMELVIKSTGQLLDTQEEYRFSLEDTIKVIDYASDALVLLKQNIDNATIEKELEQAGVNKSIQAEVQKASADYYLKTRDGSTETMSNYLSPFIESMISKRGTEENKALAESKDKTLDAIVKNLQNTRMSDVTAENLSYDYLLDEYQISLARSSLLKQQGADTDGSRGIDNEYKELKAFSESVELLISSIMAEAVEKGDTATIAEYAPLYYLTRDEASRLKSAEAAEQEKKAEARTQYSNQVQGASQYFANREAATQAARNALGIQDEKKTSGAIKRLSALFLELAETTGELNPNLKEFREILAAEHQQAIDNAVKNGDLAGLAQANKNKGIADWNTASTIGEGFGAVGTYMKGGFQEIGANAIAGTDVGAFAQGTMMGGPIIGLINMFMNALGNLVGSLEIMGYALNPISNLLQGFAPLLKMLMLPLVLVSHGFETLGDLFSDWITNLVGEDNMKALDDYYDSLTNTTDKQEELAQKLQTLNDILDKTRRAMIEAEQYYLKRNMEANAQWAAQMQGAYVMDNRSQDKVTKVNDMILTPHGNFSTAPDDYLLAMKDPTSLMGKGGGASVEISFVVNNTVSDMVETTTEERTNNKGQKELIVTISKMVASDYASGRNGWDSAISGRESRRGGRSISR